MSGGPADASIQGDGFRWYQWPADAPRNDTGAPINVLSVTSIRNLCGTAIGLVNWQLSNVANAATGMTQRTWIGPRGGVNKGYFPDGWDPANPDDEPPFIRMVREAKSKDSLVEARKWLLHSAERPRDTAAIRGTIVHEAIEIGATSDRVDDIYLAAAVDRLSPRDRDKVKRLGGITDDDVAFVRHAVAQYEDMREQVPFVMLAKEPQVWNLTAGYAGSADALAWFLPEGTSDKHRRAYQKTADRGEVTQDDIAGVGGTVALFDWKTSADLHTENIVQVTAYQAAEFVGSGGVIDERLTAILAATSNAAIIHIRPDAWGVHFTEFRADVLYAFLGSVAFARFLATYQEPNSLFTHELNGAAVVDMESVA